MHLFKTIFLLVVIFSSFSIAQEDSLLESFENGFSKWKLASDDPNFKDEYGTSLELSDRTIEGKKSLRIGYKTTKGICKNINYDIRKASILFENANDFSQVKTFKFDIFTDNIISVALGLSTGGTWTWHESEPKKIMKGEFNTVKFNINNSKWKTEASKWQFNSILNDKATVQRIAIILFLDKDKIGYALIDNIVIVK
jgi:hypothetical protein